MDASNAHIYYLVGTDRVVLDAKFAAQRCGFFDAVIER
jgi:hypothetical protein